MNISIKERFSKKMGQSDENGCMNWKGAPRGSYGAFQICDKKSKYRYNSTQLAHRVSYELFVGNIPDGLCVCHKCDNRKCVNPEHLFLGTYKDNVNDMVRKDRCNMKKGESHFGSKLKESDIKEIFYLSSSVSQRDIARKFNVSQCVIQNVLHHKTWSHVSEDMINMTPKGRRPEQKGAKNPRAKLSLQDAIFILKNTDSKTTAQLANDFSVSMGTIRNIKNGNTKYINKEEREKILISKI